MHAANFDVRYITVLLLHVFYLLNLLSPLLFSLYLFTGLSAFRNGQCINYGHTVRTAYACN